MAATKSGIVLSEGEEVVVELEQEFWATSSNPIAKFFGGISKFCSKICGYRVSGWIVITNKRVVEVKSTYNCWCVESSKEIKYVLPSSVKEVGYTKVISCGCCCPVINFYYEAHTQRTQILISEGEAEAQRIVDAFYAAIAAANK